MKKNDTLTKIHTKTLLKHQNNENEYATHKKYFRFTQCFEFFCFVWIIVKVCVFLMLM